MAQTSPDAGNLRHRSGLVIPTRSGFPAGWFIAGFIVVIVRPWLWIVQTVILLSSQRLDINFLLFVCSIQNKRNISSLLFLFRIQLNLREKGGMGVRRLFSKWGQKFSRGDKNLLFAKNTTKKYYFSQKVYRGGARAPFVSPSGRPWKGALLYISGPDIYFAKFW